MIQVNEAIKVRPSIQAMRENPRALLMDFAWQNSLKTKLKGVLFGETLKDIMVEHPQIVIEVLHENPAVLDQLSQTMGEIRLKETLAEIMKSQGVLGSSEIDATFQNLLGNTLYNAVMTEILIPKVLNELDSLSVQAKVNLLVKASAGPLFTKACQNMLSRIQNKKEDPKVFLEGLVSRFIVDPRLSLANYLFLKIGSMITREDLTSVINKLRGQSNAASQQKLDVLLKLKSQNPKERQASLKFFIADENQARREDNIICLCNSPDLILLLSPKQRSGLLVNANQRTFADVFYALLLYFTAIFERSLDPATPNFEMHAKVREQLNNSSSEKIVPAFLRSSMLLRSFIVHDPEQAANMMKLVTQDSVAWFKILMTSLLDAKNMGVPFDLNRMVAEAILTFALNNLNAEDKVKAMLKVDVGGESTENRIVKCADPKFAPLHQFMAVEKSSHSFNDKVSTAELLAKQRSKMAAQQSATESESLEQPSEAPSVSR